MVTRSIATTIVVYAVFENDQAVMRKSTIAGKRTVKQASKILSEKLGKEVLVQSCDYNVRKYGMPLEEFMKAAKVIESTEKRND